METAVNAWTQLGEANYAQVGFILSCLPGPWRNKLNKSQWGTLQWAFFFVWKHGYHAGRATYSAQMSQAWVGEKLDRSRWTVARALDALVELGLLGKKQLGQARDGTKQANRYWLTTKLLGLLPAKWFKSLKTPPCSKSAPEGTQKSIKREGDRFSNDRSPSQEKKDSGQRGFHKLWQPPDWMREARG